MIICYFNIKGIPLDESETNSPLVINWNWILSFPEQDRHQLLYNGYDGVGKVLIGMIGKAEQFCKSNPTANCYPLSLYSDFFLLLKKQDRQGLSAPAFMSLSMLALNLFSLILNLTRWTLTPIKSKKHWNPQSGQFFLFICMVIPARWIPFLS